MSSQSYLELIEGEIIEFFKSNTCIDFEKLSKYLMHTQHGKEVVTKILMVC